MDSDLLTEAESIVDAQAISAASMRNARNDQLGQAMAVTYGGVADQDVLNFEETPLLKSHKSHLGQTVNEDELPSAAVWPGLKDFEGMPWYKTPSIFWMILPFLVFALSFGGSIIPKLNLITDLICSEYLQGKNAPGNPGFIPVIPGETNDQCRIPQVSRRVAIFALVRDLLGGLLSAVVAPKLGALSDRYGRTKVIALTSMGMLVGEVIFIVVATLPGTFSVYWLIIGFFFDGLSGSFIAGGAIAHAYAADCTAPDKRNVVFGYFHGCLFTGIAIGPIIAGLIVKKTHHLSSIFYVALFAHLFFIFCLLFIIPESLSKRRQLLARAKQAKLNELSRDIVPTWAYRLRHFNIFKPLKILWPVGRGSSPVLRRNLALLAAIDATMFGIAMGAMTVVIIYTRYQFGWETYESSVFSSIVNSCRVTVLLVLLPLISRVFRGKMNNTEPQPQRGCDKTDLGIIRTAIVFDTLGFLGFTLVRTPALFTLSGVIAAVGGIGAPTLQSALTKHVPTDQTGQILGASGTLHALARVVGPTVFNAIYAATVGKYTQTVFLCLTICFSVSVVLSWFVKAGICWDESSVSLSGTDDDDFDAETIR